MAYIGGINTFCSLDGKCFVAVEQFFFVYWAFIIL